MAEILSQQTRFVDDKGVITREWFRFLVSAFPDGLGNGIGVLHGNPNGSPTWGPVNLASDVSGVLPDANGGVGAVLAVNRGGTGITVGVSGGILAFTAAGIIASSGLLSLNRLMVGGGAGAAPLTIPGGGSTDVLKGGVGGTPLWAPVALTTDVVGTLPVVNGGTGVTTSTGTGNNVLSSGATLSNTQFNTPTLSSATILGQASWTNILGPNAVPQLDGNDVNTVSVTAVATTIVNQDRAMFFIVHDATSGSITVGAMDAVGGVAVFVAGIAGIAFTRLAGTGLRAAVTAGANPRSLRTFAIAVGAA